MKYTPLLKKYQKSLIEFANTPEGRGFWGIPSEDPLVVEITKNSYKSILGKEPIGKGLYKLKLKATYFTYNRMTEILVNSGVLDYLETIYDNKYFEQSRGFEVLSPTKDKIAVLGAIDPFDYRVRKSGYPNLHFITSSTYNPDADPETSSWDGYVGRQGTNTTMNDLVTGSGTRGTSSNDIAGHVSECVAIFSGDSSGKWNQLRRVVTVFDTSDIGDKIEASSGTVSLYGEDKKDELGATWDVQCVKVAVSSQTSHTISDYQSMYNQNTTLSSAIVEGSLSASSYNGFSLNVTGLAEIKGKSYSQFGFRNATHDIGNSAPSWSSISQSWFAARYADDASNPPKLDFEYEIVVSGGNPIFMSSGGLGVG